MGISLSSRSPTAVPLGRIHSEEGVGIGSALGSPPPVTSLGSIYSKDVLSLLSYSDLQCCRRVSYRMNTIIVRESAQGRLARRCFRHLTIVVLPQTTSDPEDLHAKGLLGPLFRWATRANTVQDIHRCNPWEIADSISAWRCPPANSLCDCCHLHLTKSLRDESHRLADSRIFPEHREEVVVCLELQTTFYNRIVFTCRNQLTQENAYHLLHLLHHLNGQNVWDITLIDRISNGSTRLNPGLFSSLASAYTDSGVRPPLFSLHAKYITHFPPPRRGELLLHPTTLAQVHFSTVYFPYEGQATIDWLKASMGIGQPVAGSDTRENLLDVYLRSCDRIQLDALLQFVNWDVFVRGEEVELLIGAMLDVLNTASHPRLKTKRHPLKLYFSVRGLEPWPTNSIPLDPTLVQRKDGLLYSREYTRLATTSSNHRDKKKGNLPPATTGWRRLDFEVYRTAPSAAGRCRFSAIYRRFPLDCIRLVFVFTS